MYLRKEVIVRISCEIISCRAAATERLAVFDLLDVAQATCDALIAVTVESIEINAGTNEATGIHLATIKDGLNSTINDLGLRGAIGINEVTALIGFVITLNVTVTQRKLQSRLVGDFTAELSGTVTNRVIDRSIDSVDRLLVRLGDDVACAVLGGGAIDAGGLPDIGVGLTTFVEFLLLVISYSSVISLKSLFAPVVIMAGRLSDAGTSVGFPCGFFTYSPSISEKVFFPISFSISVIEIRLFL